MTTADFGLNSETFWAVYLVQSGYQAVRHELMPAPSMLPATVCDGLYFLGSLVTPSSLICLSFWMEWRSVVGT